MAEGIGIIGAGIAGLHLALYPAVFERVDPAEFRLTGPDDLVQGALTPTVREDYAQLSDGRWPSPSATRTRSIKGSERGTSRG
ncbi:MAG TPA: hypothetical protein VF060_15730 [Trebonia sp.]